MLNGNGQDVGGWAVVFQSLKAEFVQSGTLVDGDVVDDELVKGGLAEDVTLKDRMDEYYIVEGELVEGQTSEGGIVEGEAVGEFVSKLPLFACSCASPSHPVHHFPLLSPANILACYIDVAILFPSSVVFSAPIGDPSYCHRCLRHLVSPEMVLLIQLSSSSSFSHELRVRPSVNLVRGRSLNICLLMHISGGKLRPLPVK